MTDEGVAAARRVNHIADRLIRLSHEIHRHPELGFEEERACGWIIDELASLPGFSIERGVGGLPTAFTATAGSGDLTIALCAEYDALPAIGHACGHNIIAAATVGAAAALAPLADDLGVRVKVVGTPAEEGGGGKAILLERGVFDDVHVAMMVHPAPRHEAAPRLTALASWTVDYFGHEAHAAAFPHMGVNAADAMTVANVSIGLLRQQFHPSDRVHGVTTHGGDAANVIPARTSGDFYVRSETRDGLAELEKRVRGCFEAGAVATGCRLEIQQGPRYDQLASDARIVGLYERRASELGRAAAPGASTIAGGSTDMGNISQVIPSIHPLIDIGERQSSNHQPEFAAACVTSGADAAVHDGALLLALTAIDIASDEVLAADLMSNRRDPNTSEP